MGLDALCMEALACELRKNLLGARVDKVNQPGKNQLVLLMHGQVDNFKLLLSAEPGMARAQITYVNRENPAQPPVLCMLLRKHLTGGRLIELVQPENERIFRFVFDCVDELGDPTRRHLILEAMGRSANIMLTDREDRILACTHRVEGDLAAGKRQISPGSIYRPPEPRPGVPPLLGRELEFRGVDVEEGLARWKSDIEAGRYQPTLLLREGKAADFSFLPILQYGISSENVKYPTFAELLDAFYTKSEDEQRVKQRGGDLLRAVHSLRERTARKLANQSQELETAKNREGLRIKGDLIMSNLHTLTKGAPVAHLENYYDPLGGCLEVTLDPLLTPQQNAARYYRDYAKAKTAEEMLTAQIAKGRAELDYLDSVLESLKLAEGDRDLEEIRRELEETGYLRRKKAAKKQMKAKPRPLEFTTSSGLRVSVGKNNLQNDHLTHVLAGKGDIWFHAQKSHGAHVILWTQGETPDAKSLEEAAGLAAYYSEARGSSKVPVDFTPVKFVKKPNGAKPGMVVYTTYQTVIVDPKTLPN